MRIHFGVLRKFERNARVRGGGRKLRMKIV
jgi:hypothetical protein